MPVTFRIPIFEPGNTLWYDVSTIDFYTFELKLFTYYSSDLPNVRVFTITDGKSDCGDNELVQDAIAAIDEWIKGNVVRYEVK